MITDPTAIGLIAVLGPLFAGLAVVVFGGNRP